MLGRSGVVVAGLLLSALAGCTAGGDMTPRDSGTQRDTGAPPPRDSGPSPCTTAAECDDGIACTLDECVVGNVCRYTPLDARCNTAAGERCLVGHGCRAGMPTDCETDEDCQDGSYCNGAEQCIVGRCYMGTARDCNDGNACTMDVCDDAMGRCRYELVCDAGTGRFDAGPGCDPFDPDVHYTGTFELLPGRACDAGLGSGYTISTVSFSRSGGVLTVTAGPFTLTQSPAPTGPAFDVSGSGSCASSVRLTGTFECEALFRGTWSITHAGTCSTCGSPPPANVAGMRL